MLFKNRKIDEQLFIQGGFLLIHHKRSIIDVFTKYPSEGLHIFTVQTLNRNTSGGQRIPSDYRVRLAAFLMSGYVLRS